MWMGESESDSNASFRFSFEAELILVSLPFPLSRFFFSRSVAYLCQPFVSPLGRFPHVLAENWPQASTDFFESFKQFDESGSPQRVQVLKYLVLSYMLMGSDINPFDSQETKP